MEQLAEEFLSAMREMLAAGRPAWKALQELCADDPNLNISEAIAWLEDIDGSNEI